MDIMKILRDYEWEISMIITWLPTVLFLLGILFAILIGLARGFRKSVILFIHMLIAGGICLAAFLFIVNMPDMDGKIVYYTNFILDKFGYNIQDFLGVGRDNQTLREMLLEVVTSNMSQDDIVYYLVTDNGAYIGTLVEMAYRIVIFTLLSFVYAIILAFLKIVYWIFYPVRRTIRKHNKQFKNGEISEPYHKRRGLGALVGGIRGFIVSLIGLSFTGALIFVVSGGSTNPSREELGTKDAEISFGSEEFNLAYDYYSYICDIGDTGVFKVLNNIKDSNNTPYYFYICDLVLQGGIKDDKLGVDGIFYIRDEVGSYLGFAKDVMKLILTYADQEDLDIILENVTGVSNGTPISYPMNDQEESNEILDTVLRIMSKPGFCEDFADLIDAFEAKTYFVNIALSSLTSLVNHIDLVVDDPQIIGLIDCLFGEGEGSIKVTDLVTEDDVKYLFKTVITLVANGGIEAPEGENETEIAIGYVKQIAPLLQQLSLFNDRKEHGNRVLGSLYTYCAETLVADLDFTLPEMPMGIDWMKEINMLLSIVDPAYKLYTNIYDPENPDATVDNVFMLFDESNPNSGENELAYDTIVDCLSESKLLDILFKASFVTDFFDSFIEGIGGEEAQGIPLANINFGNSTNPNGEVVLGECYNLFTTLKEFIKNGGRDLYDIFTSEEIDSEALKNVVNLLANDMYPNDPIKNKSLADALLESKVLHYTLSAVLSNVNMGEFKIIIPDAAAYFITEEGISYKIIKKSELQELVKALSGSIDVILDLTESEEIDIASVVYNDSLMSAIDKSLILEGTVSHVLVSTLSQVDAVVLPLGYDNVDAWVNTRNENGSIVKKGELRLLIDAIKSTKDIDGFDINDIMNGSFDLSVLENVTNSTLNTMLSSKVLHYTFSDLISNFDSDISIVVPKNSLVPGSYYDINNESVSLVETSELINAIDVLFVLVNFGDEITIEYRNLFTQKQMVLSSNIIQATVINILNDMSSEENSMISIPNSYKIAAEEIATKDDNLWFGESDSVLDDELYVFLTGVEELLGGEIAEDFDLETGLNDISIKSDSSRVIAQSAVLNSTIAKAIINAGMYIPVAVDDYIVYENDRIVEEELTILFENIIEMFGTNGSMNMDDLAEIDITSKEFTRTQIDDALSSKIFAYNISTMIIDQETLVVPVSITRNDIQLVDVSKYISIIKFDELNVLFDSVFALFGDTINLNDIDTTQLVMNKDKVYSVLESDIITATISKEMVKINEIYVPELPGVLNEVPIYSTNLGSVNEKVISKEEMRSVFDGFFAIFGDEIDINDIDINAMELYQSDLETILSSKILSATISHEFVAQEALYIPTSVYNYELTHIYNKDRIALINEEELYDLFNAVFHMFGVEQNGDLHLNIHEIDVDNLTITQEEVELIVMSEIMEATISHNMVVNDMLSVPKTAYTLIDTYGRNVQTPFVHSDEMRNVFDLLFDLFDEENDGIDINNDINSDIVINHSNKKKLLSSKIMTATISTHIIDNVTGIVIVDSVLADLVLYGKGSRKMINEDELENLLESLLTVLGGTISISDTTLDSLTVPTTESARAALVSSTILRATITEQVFANETKIRIEADSQGVAYKMEQVNGKDFIVLSINEIVAIMNGMDIISGRSGEFNRISFDVAYLFGLDQNSRNELIDTIKGSAVYRYLISDALCKPVYGSYSIYELVGKYDSQIPGVDMVLSSIPLPSFSNFYHIIPNDVASELISYDATNNEVVSTYINVFTSSTIDGLKYCEYVTL